MISLYHQIYVLISSMYCGINDHLIIKERIEFDKRFFEFTIEPKYLVKVK